MAGIMEKVLVALAALVLCLGSGCATFQSKLPVVVTAVTDGSLIVDSIESFEKTYFLVHPDTTKQAAIESAIAQARVALDAVLQATNGASDIDQAKIDDAFSAFKVVYSDLLSLASSIGVKTSGDKIALASGGLTVPVPLALKQVH